MAMTREEMQRLASYGRNGDTMLAHINPQEAALLKSRGGAGTINPKTGLPEFYGMNQMAAMGLTSAPAALPAFGTTEFANLRGSGTPVAPAPFDRKFADVNQYGMGVQQVTGYTLPSDQTFANIPLVTKYDPKGNFNYLTLEPGQYLTPDPSRPNIQSVPRLNASGEVVDWGIVDTDNLDNGSFGSMVREIATELGPILAPVLAYYMPGITGALAPSLSSVGITNTVAQSIVSSAIANTVVQVAQGRPLEDALQSAVTTAVVTSGSPAIAKDINKVISNPAVTDAIVSAGSSAAITALNGGSESDITRNIIGGIIGSGVATATGSNVAGATAGGAITGGVAGAITGGVGAYGSQAAAEERATKAPKQTSEFVSGINLAAADTGTVSDASNAVSVEMSGTPIFADSPKAKNVKAPFGFDVMPIEMADNKPEGSYYDYTQNAWIAPVTDIQKFTTMSPITSGDVGAGRVSVAPGIDLTQPTTFSFSDNPTISSGYNPNILSTSGITFSGGGNTTNATFKPNITPANIGIISGSNQQPSDASVTGGGNITPSLDTVNVTGRREETPSLGTVNVVGGKNTTPSLDTVNVTAKKETPSLGTVNVTGRREDIPSLNTVNVTGKKEEDIPSLDTVTVKPTPDDVKLPPVEDKTGKPVDKPYTPKIFTYAGVKSTLPDTLKTTLEKVPAAKTTTGTSVGLGGRGEIESKESGKKRKTVWNEESLRLKDALGL